MVNKKIALVIIFILLSLAIAGCGNNELMQPPLERDRYNTGGKLTFEYDEISKVATFGGEGEVVQFYNQDIARGFNEKGCRVGVQISVPKIKDYKRGSAVVNGTKMSAQDYIFLSGEQNLIASFYPIVSEKNRNITINIKWQDDKKEQTYHIIVKPGTFFMSEQDLAR